MAFEDDSKLPPLGDDTEKFLEDTKKGKSRSFLLVCKGAKVRYLALRKKPVKKAELNEAKKLGYKGEPYFGIVTGKGLDLVFNLLKSEYDAEPVKDKALKDFLEEHAGLKAKPTFLLVETLPVIPFDEEDLKHPLIARFMKLETAIHQTLERRPDATQELTARVTEIRELLQDGAFDAAVPKIDLLVGRLKELVASGADQPPPAPPPPPESQTSDPRSAKLAEAIKKLKPLLDQVVTTHPARKGELVASMAQVVGEIKAGKFEEASGNLVVLGKLLRDLAATPSTTPTPSTPTSSTPTPEDEESLMFRRRQASLEKQLNDARRRFPDRATKLGSVWAFAEQQAEAKNWPKAHQALDGLQKAISELLAAAARVPASLVAWQKAATNSRFQLRRLQFALRGTKHPTALQIVSVIDRLVERLETTPASQMEAEQFEQFLRSDATITSAETPNPFGIELAIRQPLLEAISALKSDLPSVA